MVPPLAGPRHASRSRWIEVGGLRYHIREWGQVGAPPVVMVHGARDSSATFQFLVDAMESDWHVISIDWRGHGLSDWAHGRYWLSDFLGDLDQLFPHLTNQPQVRLVGHSMGANIAGLFASMRPGRIAQLVLLDALGNMLDQNPAPMADLLQGWLDSIGQEAKFRIYPSVDAMSQRLLQANPRLAPWQAEFLARQTARPLPDGGYTWLKDPTFERSLPTLHNGSEWCACWKRITAPTLCLFSSDRREHGVNNDPQEVERRAASFRAIEIATIPGTSHNLHHDAPQTVARAIEKFFQTTDQGAATAGRPGTTEQ